MKPGVRERIEYQAQERIAEKRAALEEQLWAVPEADSGFRAARRGQRRRVTPCKGGRVVLFVMIQCAREMAINIARRKVLVALGGTAFASPLVAKRERP
jgi:hypothetical protein